MKEKNNKRWGLKLLSFLCAFLVWLGVVNVADPIMTETVEVPVEIVNEEILTANDLTYEIVGKKTATISYEVKMTNAYRIRPGDFRAYADMKDLWSVTGSIPITIEVLNHSEYLEGNPVTKTSTIKIETEPLQKKRFDLTAKVSGELEDSYEVGEITMSPSYVYVEGPESLIGQISSAGIEINAEGVSADLEGYAELRYYDANGNRITLSDRVESNSTQVAYKMTVLKVKNLSLDFQVSGEVASGYRFTGVQCDVQSVPVVGLKSVLASLHTITIPGSQLNISGARSNVTRTINLEDYLPENVTIAGMESHEIQVVMTVEKLEDRRYTLETRDLNLEGEKDEFIYRPEEDTVTVTVRALTEELDSLVLDGSDLTVDVSSMTEGTHAASASLELDAAYEIVDLPIVEFTVLRIPDGPGEAETAENSQESQESESAGEALDEHQLVPPRDGVEPEGAQKETGAVEAGASPAESTAPESETETETPAETAAAG